MAKRHIYCGHKVKKIISIDDTSSYKIRTYYCKYCKKMLNGSEIETKNERRIKKR